MNTLLYQLQTLSNPSNATSGTDFVYPGQSLGSRNFSNIFWNSLSKTQSSESINSSLDAIFDEASQLYQVPVQLLKAVGKAESNFNANAVSPAGAQGVMQLMPATAASLGVEDPFDARSNIMGGARYLAEKLRQYNGDIDLTLAAYNAGSGNVAKFGGIPPFTETQNYVKKVKQYMGMDLTAGQSKTGASSTVQDTVAVHNGGTDSRTKLSSETAQYMIDLMRLQMMSRASTITASLEVSDEDGNGFW